LKLLFGISGLFAFGGMGGGLHNSFHRFGDYMKACSLAQNLEITITMFIP